MTTTATMTTATPAATTTAATATAATATATTATATTATATTAAATTGTGPAARLPLVVTGDDDLLDDLLRLAAAAGTEVEVAGGPVGLRERYRVAPLVVVGADQLTACLRARLPRRGDVVVVARDVGPGGPGPVEAEPWDPARRLGARHIAVLPAAESWLVERFAASRRRYPPGRVIAVQGGRGGAGASVLAAGLAATAAGLGRRALLVDADPLGGGLDLTLGWEDEPGPRWPELADPDGRVDPDALVGALPGRGELVLLAGDRRQPGPVPAEAMAGILAAGRAARDLVVVDVPRRLDPAATAALAAADEALLIVPAEVRAITAAAAVAAATLEHCADVRLVVRGPSPGRLSPEEVSRSLRLPVAGALRPEVGLPATLEGGMAPTTTGRGPLAVLCRRLVREWCPVPERSPRPGERS